MANELTPYSESFQIVQGKVDFLDYEQVRDEADQLAQAVSALELTEENRKEVKALVARMRKRVDELNKARIEAKKYVLQPYQELETQVREIESIVKEAEDKQRNALKELENAERQAREEHFKTIWDKRVKRNPWKTLVHFEDFIEPAHLNKTTSSNAVERDMATFIKRINDDWTEIQKLENSTEILEIWLKQSYDLKLSVAQYETNMKRREQLAEQQEKINQQKAIKKTQATFTITGELNIELVESFLKQCEMDYIKK